ncbi:glutathione S-transferase [Phenylobacterium sp. Root77]|uniref:glutathione S-transferase family protein n=1 Tax=unclassified Phenylobacterium TaxID=2640670 RepID=UPI000701CD26|nr:MULTISPECIES: glutathione S-transferase family protein [unclassified Phenylobacterium]KQW71046.1 glutathione S-transferase [Phenylobacterium sp. Root1277]KQW95796.1 glutathione S-transferase [Phenylobacterium sp. Root1290]KRC41581.1 glutathione S-transferase [Phenylobacterium sp. Root77]
MIEISAFKWVPPFARGLVRDLRVRWALEEAGLSYRVRLIDFDDRETASYRALQPFGQVPAYREGELSMFESGAIVLRIAARSPALSPSDPDAQARAATWLFAALNSIEPPIQNLAELDLFNADQEWARLRRPGLEAFVRQRLGELAANLGDKDYLEAEGFTAGDLMMVTVLRNLRHTDLMGAFPTLAAYQARCEARPAFQKALAAQMADFVELEPATA